MEDPICEFRAVSKDYAVRHGFFASSTYRIKALDRVNLSVKEGEILGLVGESGCGKSTLARIALGLESPTSGQVLFSGDDIADFDKTRLQNFRRQAQMVFQDPFSSLNPKKTVLKILSEPLKIHRLYSKNHYKERVIRLLKEVGLDEQVLNRYPHEFSGGQRQRIGLARALATNPKMIVADEPTSALDVSIQAQIINLFLDLHERHRLSLLFISHDLPVIQFVSHRVAVMYKGQLMELMPKNAFLQSPNHQITKSPNFHHPYTSLLLNAVPVPDPKTGLKAKRRDHILTCCHEDHRYQNGCAFSPRCSLATDRCRTERPVWTEVARDHFIACHFIQNCA
ncbi:MAG: ABC transporter ATP-binding protein [Deltaproteobacteria bacterium]|nr:ABC transporter ATP-binding protein [Deltaproteobacteria bacterium]